MLLLSCTCSDMIFFLSSSLSPRMASLIKKDPSADFVLLNITLETETEDDLPPIKYFWAGKK